MSTNALLNEFKEYSEHPKQQLAEYKSSGQKVIGVLPYYAPRSWSMPLGWCPWASGVQHKDYQPCERVLCNLLLHHRSASP